MSDLPPPVPQAPLSIRLAGVFGVLAGLVDAVSAVGVTLWSIGAWHAAADRTGPEAQRLAVWCLWIACGLCLAFSLAALTTGLSLLMGWRFGRKLALTLLPLALLTALGSQIAGAVGKNLAELAIQHAIEQGQTLQAAVQIRYFSPVPFLGLVAGVAVMVMVMQESARAWAAGRGAWAPPGAAPAAEPAIATRPSTPALLSLIFAFLPFLMLTQLASIVLGCVALRQIRRSEGKLSGRWMALTGLIVSSLLWLLILSAVGAAIVFSRLKPATPSVEHGPDAMPTAPAQIAPAPGEPAPTPPAPPPPEPAPPEPAVTPPPAPEPAAAPTADELADEDSTAADHVALYLAETTAADGLVAKPGSDGGGTLYLHAEPLLRGTAIAEAQAVRDASGQPAVDLTWAESAEAALAGAPEGKTMALVVDGEVVMAAVVRGPLGLHMQISGHLTDDQAAALARRLRGK